MIDLSQLPAPEVVEPLDFEGIYQDLLATFRALMGDGWTAPLESDPVVKLLELCAYREVQLRARINDAARSVLLAYAVGADLEQLAANVNVSRLLVSPGDPEASPPVDPVYENDASLRARVQRAFEGLSVAGPRAAYVFHALSADGRVADASAESPAPAEVVVTVLSREGDGSASADLLDVVDDALSSEEVRPVADRLTVQGARSCLTRSQPPCGFIPGRRSSPSWLRHWRNWNPMSVPSAGLGAISGARRSLPPCMWKACSVWNCCSRPLMWC